MLFFKGWKKIFHDLPEVQGARPVPNKIKKKELKFKKKKIIQYRYNIKFVYLRHVDLRQYGIKLNYGVKLNYGITALRHLRFTAFYYGVTARAVTVKIIPTAPIVIHGSQASEFDWPKNACSMIWSRKTWPSRSKLDRAWLITCNRSCAFNQKGSSKITDQ